MPVPLSPDKHPEPSLFSPQHFLSYMQSAGKLDHGEGAPKSVIICYQKSLFDAVVKSHQVRFHAGYFGEHLAYLEETGRDVAMVGNFGIGSPAAAVMLEELIAWGVKAFVSLGFAGGLVKGLYPGSLVLCTEALRDEGLSYHYAPEGERALPDPALTAALAAAFARRGAPYREGPTWTTDAIYRETWLEVNKRVEQGAITVEMEASALFTVARYRAVPLASCFTISDSLAEPEWKPDFLSADTRVGLEAIFEAAVEALQNTVQR